VPVFEATTNALISMPILKTNPAAGALRGKVGRLVYVHRADGVIVVRELAEAETEPSPAQCSERNRFARATYYLKTLKAAPELYAPYKLAARIQRKRGCDLAMADALNPPVIRDVDLSAYTGRPGEIIRGCASDDFEVTSVSIVIRTLFGVLIEQGPATLEPSSGAWSYLTQGSAPTGATVAVTATALDRPGNTALVTFHHPCS
jgi:hypothetical protein